MATNSRLSDQEHEFYEQQAYTPRSERVATFFEFTPFDYQRAILDDGSPDTIITCGRQVGKTETGAGIAADAFLGSVGDDVMIAAKWQETANEMLRRTKHHLRQAGLSEDHPFIASWNKTVVESVEGARLYSKTLKVSDGDAGDNQRGKLPRVVIIDESALISREVIESVIRPMFLTHGDDHELYLFSTPRGKTGFHYEKHVNDESWSAHHVPSSASPRIDDDYLAGERASVDELVWRQEYCGEFIDLGEVYIPRATYKACQPADGVTAPREPAGQLYLGVDVARKGGDRTVFIPMDEHGTVPGGLIESEALSDVPGIVSRIQTLHSQHDFAGVGIDENAVGGGVVDYAGMGLGDVIQPVSFTTKSKSQMYRKLKADLEQRDLHLPAVTDDDTERLRDETVNLQYDYTANGHLKVGHAPGGTDDYADGLAIVNHVRMTTNTIPVMW